MATKTISITEEAYNKLASLKQENESFSRVIERMTRKKKLGDFFGVISNNTADKIEESIKMGRNEHKKSREIRTKKLKEAFS
jgi:predicted CopG family antitoxin